LQPFLPQG